MVPRREVHLLIRVLILLSTGIVVLGQTPPPSTPVEEATGLRIVQLGELYQLTIRDNISVSVYGEPDVTAERRIDARGKVNLPLIGSVEIEGLTVVKAEESLRKRFIELEIFIDPQVSISVVDYAPKEISVLGQVANPGKQIFPEEKLEMSIVDVITAAGGVSRIGKGEGVRVTLSLIHI